MYLFFRDLAIILIAAKFFGLIARKLKAPQVVGEIIAGLLIGPSLLGVVQLSDTISVFAEIGVILLMFSTGLGTNLKQLMKAGPIATLVACVGVFFPWWAVRCCMVRSMVWVLSAVRNFIKHCSSAPL